jgi:3-carboxy-cis,cis-muconate cycloisomerase
VHWGATSQDILDTGLVLQLRAAVPEILRHLTARAEAAAGHAERHAATPMAGRTWLQQATPITFGLKAAGWMDALGRAQDRVASARSEALVLQFGGGLGDAGRAGHSGTGGRRGPSARA